MVDKVSKTINLNDFGFDKIKNAADKAEAKKEVGDLIVNEILRYVQDGTSPVSGYGGFTELSTEYAKQQKGGNKKPNLELNGDLLDALEFKTGRGDQIEFGIFKSSQVPKADGHNNFSGDSNLPLRRFIPDENESLKRDIESKIKTIINDYASGREDLGLLQDIEQEVVSQGLSLSDVLGSSFLQDFLDGI